MPQKAAQLQFSPYPALLPARANNMLNISSGISQTSLIGAQKELVVHLLFDCCSSLAELLIQSLTQGILLIRRFYSVSMTNFFLINKYVKTKMCDVWKVIRACVMKHTSGRNTGTS